MNKIDQIIERLKTGTKYDQAMHSSILVCIHDAIHQLEELKKEIDPALKLRAQNIKYVMSAPKFMEHLLVTAFEGGINYWFREEGYSADFKGSYPFNAMIIKNDKVTHQFTELTYLKALELVHDQYPHVFHNFMEDNYDAGDADIFVQCLMFGEVIYG